MNRKKKEMHDYQQDRHGPEEENINNGKGK